MEGRKKEERKGRKKGKERSDTERMDLKEGIESKGTE